ncbi:hypothetical protein OF376_00015 [Ureaplasma miroungigenitalium]|uniref:Lipoprotein n=1 Tax=Ureaplasma miroungigenitalium TaxID=1042321 RepID=A0ABT3BLM2_9BACT|nr:hypothetical protein [Ureaplasma miroungigenitalium]MCV3728175.1 hypothetical protein [Ureaplasma miroungigenitalium]
MNKKQKRILGFVLAPIALAAVITPIVTSCSKQDPLEKEYNKLKAEYKALLKKSGIDNSTIDMIIAPAIKVADEMFKNAKNDAEKKEAIEYIKNLINMQKMNNAALGL